MTWFQSFVFATLALFSWQAFAQLQSFSAEYNTKAAGVSVGVVKHQMQCQKSACELTNIAQPSKLVSWLVNESSVETIRLNLAENDLQWLSHKIKIERKKSGKTSKTERNFYLDLAENKIISPEKSMEFAAQPYGYDMISIMYAIQFYLQKSQQNGLSGELPELYLQEDDKQTLLKFKQQNQKTRVNLAYKSEVAARFFEWEGINPAGNISAKVWLIDELNFFPGKIEIYNHKDKLKLTLNLRNQPKFR